MSKLNSQSAFITSFKALFGMTPTEAIRINDESLYMAPPTWESLSDDVMEESKMQKKKFGISIDQFRLIQSALNLEAFYDLNEVESDLAYDLYTSKYSTIEECYKYVAGYVDINSEDRDERIYKDLKNSDVLFLYFSIGLNYEEIFNVLLMQYLHEFTNEIKSYSEEFIVGCAHYPIEKLWREGRENKYESAYQRYKEKIDSRYTQYDFYLFIFYLRYMSEADAFSRIRPGLSDTNSLNKEKQRFIENKVYEDTMDGLYEYLLEAEAMLYTPEVWDDDYCVDPQLDEETDYDETDEEGWKALAMEGEFRDEEDNADMDGVYDYDFDFKRFEELCNEMSELSEEDIEKMSKTNRGLVFHRNLDVETYWKETHTSEDDDWDFLTVSR